MSSDLPALGFGALSVVAPASNASGRAADGAGAYGGGGGDDAAGGAVYWKADIMAQINARDRVQRENFRPLMDQYERLIRDDKALKARVAQLEKVVAAVDTGAAGGGGGGSGSGSAQSSPPTPASHMLGGGAGARASMSIETRSTAASLVGGLMNTAASYAGYTPLVASQREKNLEEKVAKLQDELNANYRLSNENSIALLRLKEQAERDEKLILQKEELLAKKQAELDEFVEKTEAGKGRSVQLEATVEVLRKEVVTLQKELAAREDKIKRLSEENERHVNTILKMKDEQAVVMNQMNDHITNLVKDTKQKAAQAAKDAKDKKDADKKISGDIDYNDKNSILDAVSWTSGMDVKVPTSQRRTLYITNGQATTITYNHSGSLLVSSGTDAVVRIWDTRTGTLRGTLRGATQAVMSASFSANDKMVLATGNDNAARIWSTDTSRQLHVLTGHTGKVYGGAFTGDSERVFTAAHDRTIKVWNVSSGYCKGTINCGSLCNYLGLCTATETLATAHLDTHIRLWSARNNELLHDFEDIHSQQTTCAEFSANGEMLVTNSRDNTLNVIDTRIYKVVKTLSGDAKTPYKNAINWGRAVFSPDGSWVVAGASTGSVLVWSMKTGKVETALTPEAVTKAVGHAAAAAAGGGAAKPTESLPANAITCVAWNPNGRQVASCDNSGKLIFWE